jgi:hypothetical protein
MPVIKINKKLTEFFIEKETLKAMLIKIDKVSFWIQLRWMKAHEAGWEMTPAGCKAYYKASREQAIYADFDALKEFKFIRDTEKAVLLECMVQLPEEQKAPHEFWLPKSMTENFRFVKLKMSEIEKSYPFEGTYVLWSGAAPAKDGKK